MTDYNASRAICNSISAYGNIRHGRPARPFTGTSGRADLSPLTGRLQDGTSGTKPFFASRCLPVR